MLDVILLILKILGIILLVVLALVLCSLYCVLFVAASYRMQIEKKESLRLEAYAGWLFRAVTVRFSLDSAKEWEKRLQVKILGIPVLRYPNNEKRKKSSRWRKRVRKTKERERAVKDLESISEEEISKSWAEEPEQMVLDERPKEMDTRLLQEEEAEDTKADVKETPRKEGTDGKEESLASKSKKNKRSFFGRKIQAIDRAVRRKIGSMRKRILRVRKSFSKLRKRKDELLEFWRLPEHVRARGSLLKEIRYLWKKLRPKKVRGQVRFGWEDPALTGLCMGGVSILCAWYPGQIKILPDFEHRVLEADVLVKGKVRFYVLVAVLVRVYFNKDIRHMYQGWRQL